MDFLKDFGFDPVLLVAQIINFLVVLFLLKKLMYKPLLETIKKRDSEIKSGIANKEEADRLLAEAQEKETKILQKAQERADKIVNDAKLEAESSKAEIEEAGRRESERMIAQARETIAQETREAEERLSKKIGTIAVALLEKSLEGVFGKSEQQAILKKAQSQLEKQKAL
jgi:F-type H+-transporting ATPase subunit b